MALSPAQQQQLLAQQQQIKVYNQQKEELIGSLTGAMPQQQVSAQISPTQYQTTTIPGDISVPDQYTAARPYYANVDYARDLANGLAANPTGLNQGLSDQLTAFQAQQRPTLGVPGVSRPGLALKVLNGGMPDRTDAEHLHDSGYYGYANTLAPGRAVAPQQQQPMQTAPAETYGGPGGTAAPAAGVPQASPTSAAPYNIHNLTANQSPVGGAAQPSRAGFVPLAQRQAAGQLPVAGRALANALSPGITNTVQQAQSYSPNRQKTSINPAYAATAGIK